MTNIPFIVMVSCFAVFNFGVILSANNYITNIDVTPTIWQMLDLYLKVIIGSPWWGIACGMFGSFLFVFYFLPCHLER